MEGVTCRTLEGHMAVVEIPGSVCTMHTLYGYIKNEDDLPSALTSDHADGRAREGVDVRCFWESTTLV
jgi:hypothetical protein